jgi:hypothetical protein
VIKSADIRDGYPLDEEKFWRNVRHLFSSFRRLLSIHPQNVISYLLNILSFFIQVRLWKILLLVLLSALFILHAMAIGYSFITHPNTRFYSVLPSVAYTSVSAYLLFLTSANIGTKSVDEHWPIVIHISALLTFSFVNQVICVLLPDDGTVTISSTSTSMVSSIIKYMSSLGKPLLFQLIRRAVDEAGNEREEDEKAFWYASLALTLAAATVATTINRGPALYFPPGDIYTLKSIKTAERERKKASGNEGEDTPATALLRRKQPQFSNVCGVVASNVAGRFLLS